QPSCPGPGRRRCGGGSAGLEAETIHANRARDVLHGGLAAELGRERQLALDLVVGGARKADCTAPRPAPQARRGVDAVAAQPYVLNDDVAEIDADAKPHLPRRRQLGVARPERALDLDGGLRGVDDAPELRQDVVARSVDDAAAVAADRGRDDLPRLREGANR